jgi:glyoxylase-like metal-dependent hydrolase (beta-lactamase superfamily II)
LTLSANAFKLGSLGEFNFKQMANSNVWIMHGPAMEPNIENRGFMNNPAFIESKNGIIVIDPGGNYNIGQEVLKEVKKVTKKPLLAIFNTHKHGDHWFANIAFAKEYPNVPIYAHPNMIKAVKATEANKWYGILDRLTKNLNGTKPFKFPNHEIKDGQILEIDGEKFKFFHPKKAHTDTDILIAHLNSKTLFLGDNLMKNRLGGFDGSSSIIDNIKLLDSILKDNKYTLYVPGHGPSGKAKETIEPFLTYLKILKKYASKAYKADEEYYSFKNDAIKELKEYKKWDAFNHQMGKHLNKVYQEIEELDM